MSRPMSPKNKRYTKLALIAGGLVFIIVGILIMTVFEKRAHGHNDTVGAFSFSSVAFICLTKPTAKPPRSDTY